MLHEQRFFFLAPWAIAFALSRVYGRSPFTGYLTDVIHPTQSKTSISFSYDRNRLKKCPKELMELGPGYIYGWEQTCEPLLSSVGTSMGGAHAP